MKLLARVAPRKKAGGKTRIPWKLALLGLPVVAVFGILFFYAIWAQTFDLKNVGEMPERNTVFDVDGKIYSRLAGANRVRVALNEVSPHFVDALLAREDTRFFEHGGIDWRGIARALVRDIMSASAKEGASSITQQLARNSLPLGGRTLSRKILEAMVALRIERDFTKQQILELYVNRIYFGSGCYGVQTASLAYFGKDASKLNLSESATLAGLIRSPNRFSPLRNPEGAAAQRDTVLDRLVDLKKISRGQAEEAKALKVTSHPKRMPLIQENYAMDAVQRDLNLLLTPDQIDNGGLFIYTTLDPVVQNVATQAMEAQLAKIERQSGFKHPVKANYRPPEDGEDSSMPYLQGALVAIDNSSGGIRALVGGRDYGQSKFNRALSPANRQIGSSFKPFVYTVAFMHGLLPGAAVNDGPIEPGEIEGAGTWAPGNSDGTFNGIQPVSYGLIHSRNTMSVRIGQIAGLDDVQKTATTLGLGENIPHGPAIYIGSFETNLKDLTAAYSVFPNSGVRKQAYIIERIDDADHNPIYRAAHVTVPALDPGATWMTSQLMEQVMVSGTAASAKSLGFKLPAAGKTGTTNDYKDAWFVGYTNAITCGVWVGFDQPQTIISRGYGSALALPIWTQVMTKAAQRYPAQPFQAPMPLAQAAVCSISNHLATTGCNAAGTAYDITLPVDKVPNVACEIHGGTQTQFAQKLQDLEQKAATIPNRLFQSFRKFFGGK
ncbi:MAG TPA: PBP1A family penicillin-binding protein [Chthoniobacterales bacterium]|jgi:penicillin-binding protein 1A|nr:PBP1A family penicillin-binding protein [Chthoniobacterales bacterium]